MCGPASVVVVVVVVVRAWQSRTAWAAAEAAVPATRVAAPHFLVSHPVLRPVQRERLCVLRPSASAVRGRGDAPALRLATAMRHAGPGSQPGGGGGGAAPGPARPRPHLPRDVLQAFTLPVL
ncbi:hypothetical protein R5R35_014510 [Gryllus longicercus]|uniref:Secreted protein n=1 Tax=Gryllus longicercus TaxID=2509291 RepID=A0AAN9VLU8_9ORTH